jgi:hypothetical protein
MVKKTRVILFLSCLFLFFFIASASIFYSLGYRFDLKTKKIVQTGGIFLKVEPKSVNVFSDEKLSEKTDFLFGTVLIKNLLPGKHKIRVEKEGFYPWEKVLEVKEKEVAEAKNIILIKKELNFEVLVKEVKNFWPFPDGKKILLEIEIDGDFKKNILDLDKIPPALIDATTSVLENASTSQKINGELYYLNKSGYLFKDKEKLIDLPFGNFKISPEAKKIVLINDYEIWVLFIESSEKRFLTRFSKKIGEIFWYNSDYLLFRIGNEIKITEIDNRDRLNIVNLADFKETQKIFFNQNDKKLYILNKDNFLVSEKLLP